MNTQIYLVNPKEKIITKKICSFSIGISEFIFNKSITLLITLYDEAGIIIETEFLTIQGNEYAKWSTDDNYIINYICLKYGMTLRN